MLITRPETPLVFVMLLHGSAVLQTFPLSPHFLLKKSETLDVVVAIGKIAAPETAANIRRLVADRDLVLASEIHGRDAQRFSHDLFDLGNLAGAWHVVKEL